MRFALLGRHSDGLEMARALVASGRHEVAVYSGPPAGEELARHGLKPHLVADREEVLADPTIQAVIVAGESRARLDQMRRALQSERHVLCVHPVGAGPDPGYEAEMLEADARCVLLPILPQALHPAFQRVAELARADDDVRDRVAAEPIRLVSAPSRSMVKLVEIEQWATEEVLLEADFKPGRASLPGWDVLRLVGGEIQEVFALASEEELGRDMPIVMNGQFVRGGLFRVKMLPFQPENRLVVAWVGPGGRNELVFPEGWPGPASLCYFDTARKLRTEEWQASDPWPALVESFESALAGLRSARRSISLTGTPPRLGWQDAVRALELDDAVRRSLLRHRSSTLEFLQASEEASFKGSMTLVGCAMIWLSLVLLVFSAWYPKLGWLILPAFGAFLVMQLLGWSVVKKEGQSRTNEEEKQSET